MKKLIFNLHLYIGLLCSSYLIIFGISSLQFNHHFKFFTLGERTVNWEKTIDVPVDDNDLQNSGFAIRDALGLGGWVPPWWQKRPEDKPEMFELGIVRQGKQYWVDYNTESGLATVKEVRNGPLEIITSLHGAGPFPNAGLPLTVWPWFTHVCFWFVVFAVISGIYIWMTSRQNRSLGMIVLISVNGISAIILLLILWGVG